MELIQNILAFLVIISIVVFVHEFGHYWVAKKCGVKIEAFAIGFGREIFGWNDKHGTRWKICMIPMGGYVQMFGDSGAASGADSDALAEMSEEDKVVAFHTQNVWKRIAIVFAGPAINFLLAIVVLWFYFGIYGADKSLAEVTAIKKESAADKANLQIGDKIIAIDGTATPYFSDVQNIVMIRPNQQLNFVIERAGQQISKDILVGSSEIKSEKMQIGLLGISGDKKIFEPVAFGEAIKMGFTKTYQVTASTLTVLGQMIIGDRSARELSGLFRIGEYSGRAVRSGMQSVLWFIAVISINLGLINLFPIPMLDGGHLLFYFIEVLRGKPLSNKTQERAMKVGFTLVMGLMIFALFNDFRHFEWFGLGS